MNSENESGPDGGASNFNSGAKVNQKTEMVYSTSLRDTPPELSKMDHDRYPKFFGNKITKEQGLFRGGESSFLTILLAFTEGIRAMIYA